MQHRLGCRPFPLQTFRQLEGTARALFWEPCSFSSLVDTGQEMSEVLGGLAAKQKDRQMKNPMSHTIFLKETGRQLCLQSSGIAAGQQKGPRGWAETALSSVASCGHGCGSVATPWLPPCPPSHQRCRLHRRSREVETGRGHPERKGSCAALRLMEVVGGFLFICLF